MNSCCEDDFERMPVRIPHITLPQGTDFCRFVPCFFTCILSLDCSEEWLSVKLTHSLDSNGTTVVLQTLDGKRWNNRSILKNECYKKLRERIFNRIETVLTRATTQTTFNFSSLQRTIEDIRRKKTWSAAKFKGSRAFKEKKAGCRNSSVNRGELELRGNVHNFSKR